MSEINNQEPNGDAQGVNEENNQQQTLDVSAQLEEMKQKLESELSEKFKSEVAGLNRKNSELQKMLKDKELEGKSEAEQKEMLLKEKENILKEIEQLNRGRLIDQELNNVGLPLEFAKRIIGVDEANIKEDVKNMKAYIDKLAQDKADKMINEKMSGKAPEGGTSPSQISLDEQIKQAQAAGDFVKVMALKEQKKSKQ